MRICTVCHRWTEMDDVIAAYDEEWCLCLYCHSRNAGTGVSVPEALRRAVSDILDALEAV